MKYRIVKQQYIQEGYDIRTSLFNPKISYRYSVQKKKSFLLFWDRWENDGYGSFNTLDQAKSFVELKLMNDKAETTIEYINL